MTPGGGTRTFTRDRLTVTLYAGFVTWGWYLYAFSPAVPLIAEEQGISLGAAGLHGTAMAGGTILTGLISSTLALHLGRKALSLLGLSLVLVGVSALLTGSHLAVTLPAVLVTSIGGGFVLSAAQPALSVHHGAAGPAALTEANAMGATVGLLAPLALGASVGLGWGWRPAVALVLVLATAAGLMLVPLRATGALGKGSRALGRTEDAALPPGGLVAEAVVPGAAAGGRAVAGRRRLVARPRWAHPRADDGPGRAGRRPFGLTFRLFITATVCGAAIEFSTTFWAPELLLERTGASDSVATASVSALVLGMSVSRYVVGPLSLRKAPEKLLVVAYAIAGLGWLVFWLATAPGLAVAGLVLAGLGYGAHYPLATALVLRSSGGRPDQAQARSSIAVGLAIGISPFLLGTLADVVGAHTAFLMVPVLVVAGGTAVALGLRSVHRGLATPVP
ncbi:MFS transporter [Cellulomonas sp. APG4]|uniref:MFS transporter n=1 Tax=Cellulomonas sp. APG4 TaxID=1538656 RepID=UPI001379BA77|nr:MFS transporter [Cellulomonas sp. APG4]NCT90550.1 MFS transporter [Cellulomonas sp. APG4]